MKTIPLTKGYVALVDDEDYAILAERKWCVTATNRKVIYAYRKQWSPQKKKDEHISMHRLILGAKEGQLVDHINGNGLDNRRSNLRLCDRAQNQWNSRSHGGTSRFVGVSWCKTRQAWRATIRYRNRYVHLGYSQDEEECALLYDVAAQILHGEFATINAV